MTSSRSPIRPRRMFTDGPAPEATSSPLALSGVLGLGLGSWRAGLATGPGGPRRYYLYGPPPAPASDDRTEQRLPLMVMLHGCGQNAIDFARITRMNLLAAQERFFVLYLEQDKLANFKGCWNWHQRRSGVADAEAGTLMNAIDDVCRQHPVDRERVAVAGLSAGASMAALLASRFPHRFKAVAMHSGVAPGAALSSLTVAGAMSGRHAAPIFLTAVGKAMGAAAVAATLPPLIVLHGQDDDVVAPSNAGDSAAIWAMATLADPTAEQPAQDAGRYPMRRTVYAREGRPWVELCRVDGLGHAWSGGSAGFPFSDPQGPCATGMFWRFAKKKFQG